MIRNDYFSQALLTQESMNMAQSNANVHEVLQVRL